jgi:hypothetical protein
MRPFETLPGISRGGIKENDGESDFNYSMSWVDEMISN